MNKDKENKSKKKVILKYAAIACAVIVIVVGTFGMIFTRCSKNSPSDDSNSYVVDDSAVEGGWDEADVAKIREGLNKSVEEGYINISMNTTPLFENGSSEGNLMIVNETINRYPQYVVISRNDTDEIIYESKGIPVGSKIERAKLDTVLPAGTYECTAMFHNVDPETGNSLGCAGATIIITVKN